MVRLISSVSPSHSTRKLRENCNALGGSECQFWRKNRTVGSVFMWGMKVQKLVISLQLRAVSPRRHSWLITHAWWNYLSCQWDPCIKAFITEKHCSKLTLLRRSLKGRETLWNIIKGSREVYCWLLWIDCVLLVSIKVGFVYVNIGSFCAVEWVNSQLMSIIDSYELFFWSVWTLHAKSQFIWILDSCKLLTSLEHLIHMNLCFTVMVQLGFVLVNNDLFSSIE